MKKLFLVFCLFLMIGINSFSNQLFADENNIVGIYLAEDGQKKVEIKKEKNKYLFIWDSEIKICCRVLNYKKFEFTAYESEFYLEKYFFELKNYGYEVKLHIENCANKDYDDSKSMSKENNPFLSKPVITNEIIKFIKQE